MTKEIQRLARSGFEILVADAETQNDLKMIARASLDSDILPCGSAGLAEGVSYWLASKPRGQRVLVVSGSVNTVTLDQISAVRKKLGAKVLEPDLSEVLMGGENREAEARRLLRDAQKAVAEGRDAILRLVESKDRLDEIRKFGRELRMDYAETVEKILSFLGDVSTEAIERCGISGLILVGGDTAINVVKGMGAYGIRIEEEVSPGIPLGRIFGGRFDGLLTITKAGGFGRERTLIDAIEKLKESLRRA